MTASRRCRRAAAFWTGTILSLVFTGCGESEGTVAGDGPVPAPESMTSSHAAPDAPRLVKEKRANLHLWVSNQSFVDDPVVLTVSVDGVPLVDQSFEVGGQHNWVLFPVRLTAGSHSAEAVSQTGQTMTVRFRISEDVTRYAVINYWHYAGEARHFDWLIQSKPVYFL